MIRRFAVMTAVGWLLGSCAFAAVDVQTLLHESVAATQRDFREADNFSWVERDVEQKLTGRGSQKSRTVKTYQVTMIDGTPYNRLTKINDQPFTPDQDRQEERKMEAERNRRLSESQAARSKRIAKYRREHQQDQAMLKEMANAFTFKVVGEEAVNGRQTYVLDAAPRPGYVPKTRDTKVLTGMRGKLWIDKADKQWVKVEAEVIHPVTFYAVASVGPGTKFVFEQAPVEGGVWQPSHFAVRVNSTVLWMARNSATDERYTNYRRTQGESARVK
jgi:hypothetical protein